MSPIFIETYSDENIHSVVAKIVRANNFKILTTEEAGNKGKSDAEQLAFASARQLAILTHNRVDFEELAQEYFAAGKTHYGIIVAYPHSPQEIARRLLTVLNQVTADEMIN